MCLLFVNFFTSSLTIRLQEIYTLSTGPIQTKTQNELSMFSFFDTENGGAGYFLLVKVVFLCSIAKWKESLLNSDQRTSSKAVNKEQFHYFWFAMPCHDKKLIFLSHQFFWNFHSFLKSITWLSFWNFLFNFLKSDGAFKEFVIKIKHKLDFLSVFEFFFSKILLLNIFNLSSLLN